MQIAQVVNCSLEFYGGFTFRDPKGESMWVLIKGEPVSRYPTYYLGYWCVATLSN